MPGGHLLSYVTNNALYTLEGALLKKNKIVLPEACCFCGANCVKDLPLTLSQSFYQKRLLGIENKVSMQIV